MERIKQKDFVKRFLAVFLAVAMVIGSVPELGLKTVQATEQLSKLLKMFTQNQTKLLLPLLKNLRIL